MTHVKRIMLVLVVLSLCVGSDHATKIAARNYLAAKPPISVMGGIFRLQYIQNTGVFQSIGANLPPKLRFWFFTVFVAIFLMGMLFFVLASRNLRAGATIAVSLIIGGGASNVLDRLVHRGAVVDFMNVRLVNVSTGIFNLADVAIMLGFGSLLLWRMWRMWQRMRD